MKNFYGEQTVIVTGVVEDILDPLKLGRAKVRLFGYHTEFKAGDPARMIPTEELPWALPMYDCSNASISGVGVSGNGLKQGSTVQVMARDGELMQDLIIMGSLPSVPQEPANPSMGFYDPAGEYPKEDNLTEPDSSRLARKEKMDETYLGDKAERRILEIPIAFGGIWNEPDIAAYTNPEYPYNKVYEVEAHPGDIGSSVVIEHDATPGVERISTWCPGGAFDDTTAEGERIIKTASNFYITVENDHLNVFVKKGNVHITATEDIRLLAMKNMGIQVGENLSISVGGSVNMDVEGILDVDASLVSIQG